MLTNAVAEVRVECAQTEAPNTHVQRSRLKETHAHTRTHKHTHTHTQTHTHMCTYKHIEKLLSVVCKFDRDLTDSGHLALAAEQTE